MISTELAIELRNAGLEWVPSDGDKFAVPGRGLDDHVFSVSEMTIEVRELSGGRRRISFNGAVEWALDSIMQSEVVWLPSEEQLRDRLGGTFLSLESKDGAYTVETDFDGETETFQAADPSNAYGRALLELLSRPDLRLRTLVEGD